MSAFAHRAHQLLANGYSPVPLRHRSKAPLPAGWQQLCISPMSPDAIADQRWYGIGLACGYDGLAIIDVDTDDRSIVAAVARALPKSNIAKVGKAGFSVAYRATSPIAIKRFKPTSGKPIVEVLSTGSQTVIPPTVHPDTGEPYQFVTHRSFFDTPLADLVPIDPEHIDALEEGLRPWCPPRVYKPAQTVDRELVNDKRMAAYARACIRTATSRLSRLSDGRHNALFDAASGLWRYVHHGIIPESELRGALVAACDSNGLTAKRGFREVDNCIDRGRDYSVGDQLPDLDQMPGATPRRPRLWERAEESRWAWLMSEAMR